MNGQKQPAADPAKRLLDWLQKHRRMVTALASAVVIVVAAVWFVFAYQQRKEAAATRVLDEARRTAGVGNLPLAATDLARLIESYRGTRAASQAAIVLAQVRLAQGQAPEAITALQDALANRIHDQFRAPAYGLLGTALQNAGSPQEAGEAFESAADATWYEHLRAEYLNDAAHAFWISGDTARAISTYERVVREHESSPGANEARIRLGELRASHTGVGG